MLNRINIFALKTGYHFYRLLTFVLGISGALILFWGISRIAYGIGTFHIGRIVGGFILAFLGSILSGGSYQILHLLPKKWRSLDDPSIDLSSANDRERIAHSFYLKNNKLVERLSGANKDKSVLGSPTSSAKASQRAEVAERYIAITIKKIYDHALTIGSIETSSGWEGIDAFKDAARYFEDEKAKNKLQKKYLKKLCRSVVRHAHDRH